jgi:hypothetical protein
MRAKIIGVVPPDTAGTSLCFARPSDPGTPSTTPRPLSDSLRSLLDLTIESAVRELARVIFFLCHFAYRRVVSRR